MLDAASTHKMTIRHIYPKALRVPALAEGWEEREPVKRPMYPQCMSPPLVEAWAAETIVKAALSLNSCSFPSQDVPHRRAEPLSAASCCHAFDVQRLRDDVHCRSSLTQGEDAADHFGFTIAASVGLTALTRACRCPHADTRTAQRCSPRNDHFTRKGKD